MDNKFAVPGAILAGALIIAVAVIYGGDIKDKVGGTEGTAIAPSAGSVVDVPVSDSDHIRGNVNAEVTIVEYSDLECPFCKNFHATMHQLVTAYPEQVAWVYRHFPLDQLHPKARKEAEATECAYELGGNEKFWAYTDKVFEITPSNNGLDPAKLSEITEQVGLDRQNFEACLAGGRQAERVDADYQNALDAGGRL
ncbi:MAG: DsbA family protein, partial [Candidatus Wildermuthbacteria bacterium]|nr:DsbA family protein [Candidatus Wildermuthbacteria bacterium]